MSCNMRHTGQMRQGSVFAREAEPEPGCLQQKPMLKGFRFYLTDVYTTLRN